MDNTSYYALQSKEELVVEVRQRDELVARERASKKRITWWRNALFVTCSVFFVLFIVFMSLYIAASNNSTHRHHHHQDHSTKRSTVEEQEPVFADAGISLRRVDKILQRADGVHVRSVHTVARRGFIGVSLNRDSIATHSKRSSTILSYCSVSSTTSGEYAAFIAAIAMFNDTTSLCSSFNYHRGDVHTCSQHAMDTSVASAIGYENSRRRTPSSIIRSSNNDENNNNTVLVMYGGRVPPSFFDALLGAQREHGHGDTELMVVIEIEPLHYSHHGKSQKRIEFYLNERFTWLSSSDDSVRPLMHRGTIDVQTLAAHAVGRALGLNASHTESHSVMAPMYSGAVRVLTRRDHAVLCNSGMR